MGLQGQVPGERGTTVADVVPDWTSRASFHW
jgi:hypothetical protein